MRGLICLKELMLIKRLICAITLFVITGTFFKISVRFQSKVCNGCNGLLQKAMMLQLFLLKGIIREFIFGI